jgi:hypothetical protein
LRYFPVGFTCPEEFVSPGIFLSWCSSPPL